MMVMSLLVGCVATGSTFSDEPISSSDANLPPVFEGGLVLDGHYFFEWPFDAPVCEKCLISTDTVFLPQGPERVIRAIDDSGKLVVLVISSKRLEKRYQDWLFIMAGSKEIRACRADTCALLSQGNVAEIKNCSLALINIKVSDGQIGISDSATNQFQVAVQCK